MQENNEMSVVSLVRMLPETKQQIETFSNMVVNSIINGEVNPLEVDYQLKCFEMAIDNIRKNTTIKNLILDEVDKYKNQEYKDGGIISVSSKTTYDFSHNPAWVALDKQKKQLEILMKSIAEPVNNENTGESTPPANVKSISKFVKYNFKK
jgi:hypothetical protein